VGVQLRGGTRPAVAGGLAYNGSILQLQDAGHGASKHAAGTATQLLDFGGENADSAVAAGTAYVRRAAAPTANEADAHEIIVQRPGIVRNLRARFKQAAGAGQTHRFVLRKNAADTALDSGAVAGTGTVTSANDLVNSFAVSAGDVLTAKSIVAGAPSAIKSLTAEWEAT
jgi:hypothetical protein